MKLRLTKQVHAPRQRVFDVFVDLRSAEQYASGIIRCEVVTDGPIREGTVFRETRVVMGKQTTEELTITAFDPPAGYGFACESCGCRYVGTFTFEPNGDGTTVTVSMESQALTLLAKLLSPLGLLTKGTMVKMMQQDLDDLAAACEANTD